MRYDLGFLTKRHLRSRLGLMILKPELNLNLAFLSLYSHPLSPFLPLPTLWLLLSFSPEVPQELLHKSPGNLRAMWRRFLSRTRSVLLKIAPIIQKTALYLRNPRWPLISRHPRFAAIAAAADDDTDRGSIEKRLTRRQQHVHRLLTL